MLYFIFIPYRILGAYFYLNLGAAVRVEDHLKKNRTNRSKTRKV